MLRLLKYLKPFVLLIVLTIMLLFVQAFADLALPSYMANIVNVGIQQGGVETAVPEAVRQSTMDKLTLFMSPADKSRVLSDCTLVDKSSPDYATYVVKYPTLAQEPVYVLNQVSTEEITWLNPVMGQAILIYSGIEQTLADPAKVAAMASSMGFDLSKLPPGVDIYTVLAKVPYEQLSKKLSPYSAKFAAMGENVIVQAAAAPIKA